MDEPVDLRCHWRQQWLHCIRDFADGRSQRQNWLNLSNPNPHWSYVEFMCRYFDDTLHSHDYEWAIGEGYVTAQEAALVAPLHRLLEQHEAPSGNDGDHEAILNDPHWMKIVITARDTIVPLAVVLDDLAERQILAIDDETPSPQPH